MIDRILFALAALIVMPASATAACHGYDISVAQSGVATYDPASVGAVRTQLTFAASRHDLDTTCSEVPVSITPRDRATVRLLSGGSMLDADIVRSFNMGTGSLASYQLGEASRSQLVRNGRFTLDFLQIAAGQFVPPGDYSANIDIVVGDRPAVPVSLDVHVIPAMLFAGEAQTGFQHIALGDLERGADVKSGFFFRANFPLLVRAHSDHQGALQHELGEAYGRIPYKAYYSGQPLDLKGDSVIPVGLQPSAMQEGSLRVVVTPQKNRYAGTYRDVLTLNFTGF